MDPAERLKHVAILGAAGKMGRGITLLMALEMARMKQLPEYRDKTFVLHAVDTSHEALQGLLNYLKTQVLKSAERNIVALRKGYSFRQDLIENHEIVQQYLWDVISLVNPVSSVSAARGSQIVFEAASEDVDLKVALLGELKSHNPDTWFFTNTSSIPISQLDREAALEGNIAGLHFYNPPAVQKLVEIASAETTREEVTQMALYLARVLGKKVAISADVPGFIGNGHFMRELLYAVEMAEQAGESLCQGICQVNTVTQDFLLRPMGIFQLMDYVGIDVCRHILKVMNPHFPNEQLHSHLLDTMYERNLKGGQHPDGTQKPGFFSYNKTTPVEVYDLDQDKYVPLDTLDQHCQEVLGPLPVSFMPWKALIRNPEKEKHLKEYFSELQGMQNQGAQLAISYLKQSSAIASRLVDTKVAGSPGVVNLVLELGFFHAYGPINDLIN